MQVYQKLVGNLITFNILEKVICYNDKLFQMNQTKSNVSTPLMKCQRLRRLFQHFSNDILILQIYYILTATAIVASNSLLLYKLLKRRLKRADKMFIILTCSDIGVGLSSVLVSSSPLFIKNFDTLCMFSPILRFFGYIPFSFSWS